MLEITKLWIKYLTYLLQRHKMTQIPKDAIKCLDKGFVRLVDSMGGDNAIVQAARVSYGKGTSKVSQDRGLIRYLMRHRHTTPFEMVEFKFHCKMPIFVARQLIKHQVGLVWNEISRRYVDTPPTFHAPEKWRGRAKDKKQGASEEEVTNHGTQTYETACHRAVEHYNQLIGSGVCPEQAHMVLPQSMMTEWYWSGSLFAFARVCNLRCKPDAQYETQLVANAIDELAINVAPVSWKELRPLDIG